MPVPQHFSSYSYNLPDTFEDEGDFQDAGEIKGSAEQHSSVASKQEHELYERPRSREEIIARIKRDNRPAWISAGSEDSYARGDGKVEYNGRGFAEVAPPPHSPTSHENHALEVGLQIERPRSALHSGDFREQHTAGDEDGGFGYAGNLPVQLSTSPPVPWRTPFGQSGPAPKSFEFQSPSRPYPVQGRHRAVSHSSLSSSFISMPPTSPLAVQANASESSDEERTRSGSPSKTSRRRTFSPGALRYMRNSLGKSFDQAPPMPSFTRGETFPRQAHQPRRSISSLTTPPTPVPRPRRGSLLSEASPLRGTQMIGSYEESILRGRMSSVASKPLDFLAQIGVLGKGNCKSSLRCPPHIAVPFSAVFYHYGPNRNGSEAGPSPYVGTVNLEDRQSPTANRNLMDSDGDVPMLSLPRDPFLPSPFPHTTHTPPIITLGRSASRTTRSSPKGGYRIPQQGQLQLILKNPHKTAVKLFLIPYDLSDMQSGQKTWIRQRSYSAGPILDMPLDARKNLGTDRPEASLSTSDDPNDRPVLRYLIHLHICCTGRGRFYLYKTIRVVFANRVPDGKERLRNEVQLPQPSYSAYRAEAE